MVYFITGAAGFVGANIVRKLVEEGNEVHILVKSSTNLWRLVDIQKKIVIHEDQLHDRKKLGALLQKVKLDVIYHLAAHGVNSIQIDAGEMIQTNIAGTLSLLEASKEIPYKSFIHVGSSSEYGFKDYPMSEEDVCQPASFYAVTKLAAAHLAGVFARLHKKPILTVRLFSVYGPYEDKSRFIPTIVNAVIRQINIRLTPGEIRRDFVYVDDVVDALHRLASRLPQKKDWWGTNVNIGTGKEYTNDEVVSALFRVTKKRSDVEKGSFPSRAWDTAHWVADTKRLRMYLSWQPETTLDQGLLKTYDWMREHSAWYEKKF